MKKCDPRLTEQLKKLIHSMNYEFVGCEMLRQGAFSVLRIYVDYQNGITIDQCALVSRQVSALLDVENLIPGKYRLEVSSPGINRPLFELEHFEKYIGSTAKIRLHRGENQRHQYKGVITKVTGNTIHLWVDEVAQEMIVPFSEIEKANLIGDIHSESRHE